MFEAIMMALWFFAPAGLANTAPIFAANIPALKNLDAPIDGGQTYNGKRIFGDHKTWRGIVAGITVALITLILQVIAYENFEWVRDISYVDYTQINVFAWALVFAIGALGGDAIKSFFKRQSNIPSGETWFPADQLDFIIGGILASLLVVRLEFVDYMLIIFVWFLLHPAATFIGWLLRLKDKPI